MSKVKIIFKSNCNFAVVTKICYRLKIKIRRWFQHQNTWLTKNISEVTFQSCLFPNLTKTKIRIILILSEIMSFVQSIDHPVHGLFRNPQVILHECRDTYLYNRITILLSLLRWRTAPNKYFIHAVFTVHDTNRYYYYNAMYIRLSYGNPRCLTAGYRLYRQIPQDLYLSKIEYY